jgi:Holliday junction resolvase-like predicted endonuclease
MTLPKKHRGAHAELIAASWLLTQGYEVFRNVSPHGVADIIAINFETGERLLIDVKSTYFGGYKIATGEFVQVETMTKKPSEDQRRHGVRILFVMRDGSCVLSTA